MIEYIKTVNKERRSLRPWMRKLTDIFGFLGVVTAAVLYVYVIKKFGTPYLFELKTFNVLLYWLTLFVIMFIFLAIGQFIVLGIATSILLVMGKLTPKEAFSYTIKYRMPKKWMRDSNELKQ